MRKIYIILLLPFIFTNCADNKIETALKKQIELYPESRLQDIYKNFYHGRFGTEHLITNPNAVVEYIEKELQEMDTSYIPLLEYVGWDSNFVRVNLLYLKQNNISAKVLATAFIESVNYVDTNKANDWLNEWHQIINIIEKEKIQLKNYTEDKHYIDSMLAINPKSAIRHSQEFRDTYKPHYRVVAVSLLENIK